MKRIRSLLSTGLALLLALCALTAGMAVCAEKVPASEAFVDIQVDGKSIDLKRCPSEYYVLNYKGDSAKLSWTIKGGWTDGECKYDNGDAVASGEAADVAGGSVCAVLTARDEAHGKEASYKVWIYTGKPKLVKPSSFWEMSSIAVDYQNLPANLPVLAIKSSDKKVISVTKGAKIGKCKLTARKAGTAKVTVTLGVNGQARDFSATYKVKKYPNALKTLKVNGKKVDFKSKPHGCTVTIKNSKESKARVDFEESGKWYVDGGLATYTTGDSKKEKELKSGGKVKVPEDKKVTVKIALVNSKGELFEYTLKLKRKK